jgi:hypothetical protein
VIIVARRTAPFLAVLGPPVVSAILGCATPPKVTAATKRIQANPPAVVDGRVRDLEGRPVAGIGVRGVPLGAAIPWSPAVETACDGTFRLPLAAPGGYGFLLLWNGEGIVTADPRDPALVHVDLVPGQAVSGIELLFLGDLWREISAKAPADTPSCP